MANKKRMDEDAKKRIMSSQSKQTGGQVKKGSFAARSQSAADKNEKIEQQPKKKAS